MRADASIERTAHDQALARLDFDRSPFTIAWEVTRACAYSCKHCRASAQPKRDPNELSTNEGKALIEDIAGFGTNPILVFTGGDPLMRPDLFELASYADSQGLRVSLTPTATALVTRKNMDKAAASGVRRVAFSLDSADQAIHDEFRGFSGSFERTMQGIKNAQAAGLPLQVNTTVTGINSDHIKEMVDLLEQWQVVQWSVFFLVPTGRGAELPMLDAAEHEGMLNWLYDLSGVASFDLKATAAPHFRRIAIQRSREKGEKTFVGAGYQYADGLDRPTRGVNDGRGFMFVSHIGEVCPSGFLPIVAGNAREESAVEIYRDSELFKRLRDESLLEGKCGICEYREVCGGSRARAYGVTGNYLASDPSCNYEPEEHPITGVAAA